MIYIIVLKINILFKTFFWGMLKLREFIKTKEEWKP